MPSLQNYSTFGLDSSCASLQTFTDIPSFLSLYRKDKPTYILGGGSNSIFTEDFEGTVLVNRIKGISHYDTDSHHFLRVGAGENWHNFVTLCMQEKWYGFENLALIPGSVGACPIQNIGAYGREVNTLIDTVEVVLLDTGEQLLINNHECEFGYRDSIFKHELANKVLITHVNFKLPKVYQLDTSYGELAQLNAPTADDVYQTVISIRKSKLPDPADLGNAGSFFKNPVVSKDVFEDIAMQFDVVPHFIVNADASERPEKIKIPAAWLIDKAGFKGKTLNNVRCHPTQPLVLTNLGGATGEDVMTMAKDIIASVRDKFGIQLEPEVRLIGSKGLISL
ncbi:UDP-N-acetylmuramate dehydrogenase [Alteromonas australica]|uniref:UDP-N-acetylmuramate dehydrogenase n=1 Tax=Alteromonas australica TaxID=589873 RepID=UPI000E93049D|nr:UDP-N-acetylmuramate dehydrogenase [Alteromonas australica]HBF72838.1 UDP-N-acetylenolpyruvoylglucosamine reductase [Alteromonas australica]|tara:strand:+ start:1108 stop:2118 length:1011 start_codon:yes stop_codon:yes gene_type:complete